MRLFKSISQSVFDLGVRGKVRLRSSSRAPSAASFATTNVEDGGNETSGLYMITLPAEKSLNATLRFQPSSVQPHDFNFPIFPAGIYKQTKNRHETGSNLSLGTRLTVLSKRLGRKRCCDATPDRCLGGVPSHYLRFAL